MPVSLSCLKWLFFFICGVLQLGLEADIWTKQEHCLVLASKAELLSIRDDLCCYLWHCILLMLLIATLHRCMCAYFYQYAVKVHTVWCICLFISLHSTCVCKCSWLCVHCTFVSHCSALCVWSLAERLCGKGHVPYAASVSMELVDF